MRSSGRQAKRSRRSQKILRIDDLESVLLQFEEFISGEAQDRTQERQGLDSLSIPELCQELGIDKSWVYRRSRSGEIPSVKLGRSIKVKQADLEECLEKRRYRPPGQQ